MLDLGCYFEMLTRRRLVPLQACYNQECCSHADAITCGSNHNVVAAMIDFV